MFCKDWYLLVANLYQLNNQRINFVLAFDMSNKPNIFITLRDCTGFKTHEMNYNETELW